MYCSAGITLLQTEAASPVDFEHTAVMTIDSVLLRCARADAPYLLSEDFLHELFTKHKIDYVVHGDDPCLLPDGTDAYAYAKQQGRFKMIKRTEGVSSTDIVGRMLMCTRDNARFREVCPPDLPLRLT